MNRSPSTRRLLGRAAAALAVACACAGALAQGAWPNKPVRIVVPFAAGGGTDAFGRPLSAQFAKNTGQNLVIENRGGAAAITAAHTNALRT